MRTRWRLLAALLPLALVAACTSGSTPPVAHEHASSVAPVSSVGAPMSAGHEHGAHQASSDRGNMTARGNAPPGYAAVPLSGSDTARLNVVHAIVEEREFKRTVRTVGAVTADGTRSSHVHPKLRGWVEEIYVNYTGQQVRKGIPLCTIYSPEILAAELELLAVLDRTTASGGGSSGEFAAIEQRARTVMLDAARRRLSLWDVPQSEIERLESTRAPKKAFPLLAPRSGTVVAKQAVAGMYVDATTELYFVSDLSRVWVVVDLYEADVPYVKVGDKARLSIEGLAGASPESAITFIEPTIDEPTRTLKARFELDNRDGRLRPGAFVTAEMDLDAGRGLGVPESAVIRTGSRNVVFIVQANSAEPREVQVGPVVGGYYRVLSGVHAGEHVATGAQFLLDSESRIRATSGSGAAHVH